MELGTASILAQLLLIFVLVTLFAGQRHLKARRERRNQHPGSAALLPVAAMGVPMPMPMPRSSLPSAPVLAELPPTVARPPRQLSADSLVCEDLLPPCFADTCADWAQVAPATGKAPDTRFSLSDWSAQTDHVALDSTPDPVDLGWAIDAPVQTPRVVRPTPLRAMAAAMSCTIAPQAHPFA
jgi:hypothetical protein